LIEFLIANLETEKVLTKEKLKEAFDYFDTVNQLFLLFIG